MFVTCPVGRIINGPVLTGTAVGPDQKGIDSECRGLTILPKTPQREMLSFARPGSNRRSYARFCFASGLRSKFSEKLSPALRGEKRACVACGFCQDVCPAGIMPQVIHKHLYNGDIDAARRCRADLCVGCGLCSFVCPSKIELAGQITDARDKIRNEPSSGAKKL